MYSLFTQHNLSTHSIQLCIYINMVYKIFPRAHTCETKKLFPHKCQCYNAIIVSVWCVWQGTELTLDCRQILLSTLHTYLLSLLFSPVPPWPTVCSLDVLWLVCDEGSRPWTVLDPNHTHWSSQIGEHRHGPTQNSLAEAAVFLQQSILFMTFCILHSSRGLWKKHTMYMRISLIMTIAVWWSFQATFSTSRKFPCKDFRTSSRTWMMHHRFTSPQRLSNVIPTSCSKCSLMTSLRVLYSFFPCLCRTNVYALLRYRNS